MEQYGANMEPYGAIWSNIGPYGAIWNSIGSYAVCICSLLIHTSLTHTHTNTNTTHNESYNTPLRGNKHPSMPFGAYVEISIH